jgi:hypothetical protein
VDDLAQVIALSAPVELIQRIAEARRVGVSAETVLAAVWVAPLLWGGLLSDVHAILAVPAVRRLYHSNRGPQGWAQVIWLACNAGQWCQHSRAADTRAASGASEESLHRAIRQGQLEDAASHAVALCRDQGPDWLLSWLCLEATVPREDLHVSIYAAQLARCYEHIPPLHRPRALSHLARYAALVRTWDTPDVIVSSSDDDRTPAAEIAYAMLTQPEARLDGLNPQALLEACMLCAVNARCADFSVSGGGVHLVTHFDAMLHLYRHAPSSARPLVLTRMLKSITRGRTSTPNMAVLSPAVPDRISPATALSITDVAESVTRSTSAAWTDERAYQDETARRIARNAGDEHSLKIWAAVDSTATLFSPSVRAQWWGSLAMLSACRVAAPWEHREFTFQRLQQG